jgi:hypothetical protein
MPRKASRSFPKFRSVANSIEFTSIYGFKSNLNLKTDNRMAGNHLRFYIEI